MSTPLNSLWASPRLYTPMHMDALIVGTPNQQQVWAQVGMNYSGLGRGINPSPLPFCQRTSGKPATGVHLHWTLPFGLRSGAQNEAGELNFPSVPNRWLVTRFFTANAGQAPVATAWVIESDYLSAAPSPDTVGGNSTYPNEANPGQFWYIGRQLTLTERTGETIAAPSILEAQGPGDLGWSAIYDNVQNVFAFHDPVGDTSGACTYSVIGWYANPADDPLYGPAGGFTTQAQWQSQMDRLRWTLGSEDEPSGPVTEAQQAFQLWIAAHPQTGAPPITPVQLQLASQTLCHGLLYGLAWQGPAFAYPAAPVLSSGVAPVVAVGSTAAESVSAYMGSILASSSQPAVVIENLLLAFQTDRIFDYLKDTAGFAAAAQANRFERNSGGSLWRVVMPRDTSGAGKGGSQEIPLSVPQTGALTDLQTVQAELDIATRSFASAQWELFSAWWKLDALTENPPFDPALATQIQAYINLLAAPGTGVLAARNATVTQLTTQRDSAKTKLSGLLGVAYLLQQGDAPQFTQPADPVVLIAAAALDTKLDPPQDIGDSLFTRLTGQAIGGLSVDFSTVSPGTPALSLLPADLQPALAGLPTNALPKEAADLWIESLLLDPGNSTWLAALAFAKAKVTATAAQITKLAATIAMQQTLVWNSASMSLSAPAVAELSGLQAQFSGLTVLVPSIIAVTPWSPPWTPLYLDWEIEWCPSAPTPQGVYASWRLDETDFTFTGTGPTAVAGTLQMRSLLTTNYSTGLVQKIQKFLAMSPVISITQGQDLAAVVTQIGNMDIMVQSMTGLNQWMQMRAPQPSQIITDPTVAKWTEGVQTWVAATPSGGAGNYDPLRAGHFRLTNLQVVDAYGQALPGNIQGGYVLPVRAQSLLPNVGTDQALMQLTPRIAQGARLDLNLLDADNDSQLSNSSDLTSPICGWLLPNHLDDSVLVFDGQGAALGEVLKVITDSGPSLRWDPAPGSDGVLGAGPQIANEHLLALVEKLLQLGLSTTAPLDSLLGLIDVTLWSMDPLGPTRTGNLSLLLGRPIAVVRASINFRLQGDPVYEQSWANTGKSVDDSFPLVQIPLRIGDLSLVNNGSFGYFFNDDYSHCYAMYGYEAQLGAVRQAMSRSNSAPIASLLKLASNNAFALQTNVVAADIVSPSEYVVENKLISLPVGGATGALLTVLVDPRGVINAISGTLPITSNALPNGPVDSALQAMEASFRMGPLLLDPADIKLPLPANTGGKWSWIERTGVTFWSEQGPLVPTDPSAKLSDTLPTLREGWLTLGSALAAPPEVTQ